MVDELYYEAIFMLNLNYSNFNYSQRDYEFD